MNQHIAFLSILSALLLVASVLIFLLAIRVGRDTKKARELLKNARDEISDALNKINSSDPDQIQSGLQILAVLRDADLQMQILPRLTQLAMNDDPRIAAQAKATVEKMTSNVIQSATKRP